MNRRELIGMASVGVLVTGMLAGRLITRAAGGAQPSGTFRIQLTDAQWQSRLSPESYRVLRKKGTEQPGSSPLIHEHRKGRFACAGCSTSAFDSATKFESHTGWPSFWDTLPDATIRRPDFSLARMRTEVLCATCGGHLGHVFDDGPQPTGLRYCMNGVALSFRPSAA